MIHATPDDARGRRAGAYSAVNYGIRPAGALVGGWLGTVLGLRPTLVIGGVGGTLAVLFLIASPVRRIANLDPPARTEAPARTDPPDSLDVPAGQPSERMGT
jgi:hypothetical protein